MKSPSLVALALLLAVGCDASLELALDVRTDLVAGVEYDRIRVVVDDTERAPTSVRLESPAAFHRVFEQPLTPGRHVARISLERDGVEVVGRDLAIVLERSLIAQVVLTRTCRGVVCPAAGDPAGATECFGDRCVGPECVDSTDPACEGVPRCVRDADCTTTAACARPVCGAGVCLAVPDHAACGATEYCDPDTGCRPRPSLDDAGVADAGFDVGLDAPTPPPLRVRHLAATASAWSEVSVSGVLPTEPIEEAFSVTGTSDIVLLGRTSLYVFDTAARSITDSRSRDTAFAELAGRAITTAYFLDGTATLTDGTGSDGLGDAYIYAWNHGARTGSLTRIALGADLPDDLGLSPGHWSSLYWTLLVPDNARGWASADTTSSPCGATPITGIYVVSFNPIGFGGGLGTCGFYDGGCLEWVARRDCSEYAPFVMTGAPNPAAVDGIAWSSGIWTFGAS